jgi:hypothetical protein
MPSRPDAGWCWWGSVVGGGRGDWAPLSAFFSSRWIRETVSANMRTVLFLFFPLFFFFLFFLF